MTNIFLYGTLCDRELLEICLGRSLATVSLFSAKLENHSVFWVKNRNFPVIKFDQGSFAQGLAVGLSDNGALTSLDISNNSIGEQDYVNGWKPYDGEHFKYIRDKNDGTEGKYDFSNELPEGCGPNGAIAIATAIKNNRAMVTCKINKFALPIKDIKTKTELDFSDKELLVEDAIFIAALIPLNVSGRNKSISHWND